MKEVREKLNEVWDICRHAGIVEDREIVEYIAALLMEITGTRPFNQDLQPRRPRTRYNIEEAELKQVLQEANHRAGNAGVLLDRYVLFQSSRTVEKGTYPLPRHIIDFMLDVVNVLPKHDFADFACGSGGFLVHRNRNQHVRGITGLTVGVDIAPEIARIANANVALNGLPGKLTSIYNEDAFHICAPEGALAEQSFDRIATAPSFDRPSNPRLAQRVLGEETKGRNEALFTYLAVRKLREKGRAIVMVPTGLLSRETDERLRRTVVEEQTLRAVISLKEGMLYPFNDQATSLLFVEKTRSRQNSPTWFFKVEQDGYPLARSRDVTAPLLQPGDMPSVLKALHYDSANLVSVHQENSGGQTSDLALRVGWLSDAASDPRQRAFLGMLLKIPEQVLLTSIRLISILSEGKQDRHLIAEVGSARQAATFVALPLAEKEFSRAHIRQFSSRDACFSALYGVPEREARKIPDILLFRNGKSGQQFAFTSEGRLLGISAYRDEIVDAQYNLQPNHYIPEQQTVELEESVVTILSEIKQQQRIVVKHVDNLLGRAEMKPLMREQLPPRVIASETSSLLSLLNAAQARIWQHLLEQKIYQSSYALYFTREQLRNELGASATDIVTLQQTLDLLIRLGLIVQVIVHSPNANVPGRYYRLTTEQDRPTQLGESEPQ